MNWVLLGLAVAELLVLAVVLYIAIWSVGALRSCNRGLAWVYDRLVRSGASADTDQYRWQPTEQMHMPGSGKPAAELGPEWEANLRADAEIERDYPVVALTDEEQAILRRMPEGYDVVGDVSDFVEAHRGAD